MDRGMISKDTLKFLDQSGRRYLLATRRGELQSFAEDLAAAAGSGSKTTPRSK